VNYHIASLPAIQQKFDANHIQIRNLDAKMSVRIFDKDSLNAQVSKLSFEEHSGFNLNKLSMNITGNQDSLSVGNLSINLPNTSLQIANATLQYKTDSLYPALTQAPVKFQIEPSRIRLQDFAAFVPVFKKFTDDIMLSVDASGSINDLSLDKLRLKHQNDALELTGKVNLKGITRKSETYLYGQVSEFHLTTKGLTDYINHFREQPEDLPAPLARLGNLHFNGEISGFIDHLVAYGNLDSDIGSLKTDMLIGRNKEENIASYLKGQIESSDLIIHNLFNEGNPYGMVRFNAEINTSLLVNGSFSGNIQANINQFDYNGYQYENILLAGNFRQNEFNGTIEVDDPNGKLYAEGLLQSNGKNSIFNFSANLTDFRPDKLHITDKYENPNLSLSMTTDFTGNNVDNFEGHISIDNLAFLTQPDSFYLDTLKINATGHSSDRKLTVTSDILNAEVSGRYSFSTLWSSILKTGQSYLPSFSKALQENQKINENAFVLTATIENTELLSKTLKLPFTVLERGTITGQYDNTVNILRFNALFPKFLIGNTLIESGSITSGNLNDKIQMELKATHLNGKGIHNYLTINSDIADDRIKTLFSWENDLTPVSKAQLSTSTLFVTETEENGVKKLRTEVTINPTQVIIKDSIWNLEPASVTVMNGNTTIDNFYLSKANQYLRINGTASAKNPGESIQLDLKNIELEYVFDIVNIPALQFGGMATGTFQLSDLYGNREINTENLEIQDFSFNQVVQGRLNLFSEWDSKEEGILLLGAIHKNDSIWTDINGYIYPIGEKSGVSIYFDAREINIALLHPYLDAFTNTVEGYTTGNVHLFGPFSDLTLEGKAFVRDGLIGVDALNVYFSFSDTVFLQPDAIYGKNITIYDKSGNKGAINFDVRHKYLENFSLQADIQAENMLLYEIPERVNPQIYGTVYGTGNAQIKVNGQLVTIDANMRSDSKTALGFNFMNGSTAGNYDFITFKNPAPADTSDRNYSSPASLLQTNHSGTELRINCLVDVTPDANFELVMDPSTGDKIRGRGNGNLQVQYGSKSNLMMYGGYTIQSGNYDFNLQQVIHKDFQIREGSRIDFRGDPMDANLDLNATYFLTANIEDLDQALIKETLLTSVPVNCILKLNGRLQNPTISFDIDFPNSTDELERQVKSFIDTEDMMMRQIIYLLVLNKFYKPDYAKNDYRSNDFSAVASSALSSQLSGILNSLTDKVQIGTNIRSRLDGVTDTEVEMLLSSQLLDNKLIFNGNFGYKNNFIQNNAFIGEFDLEYKLTTSGEIRLKAYNHANDMYRYNMKSLTRQGVGIMFHKDFTTLSDILRRRKKITQPAE
jgi:hypothetical protein